MKTPFHLLPLPRYNILQITSLRTQLTCLFAFLNCKRSVLKITFSQWYPRFSFMLCNKNKSMYLSDKFNTGFQAKNPFSLWNTNFTKLWYLWYTVYHGHVAVAWYWAFCGDGMGWWSERCYWTQATDINDCIF